MRLITYDKVYVHKNKQDTLICSEEMNNLKQFDISTHSWFIVRDRWGI